MDQIQHNSLISLLLDFGEAMIASGAEISRVEDSLNRIGASFGAVRTEVFAITASLVLTLRFEKEEFTGSRRITSTGDTDFNKLRKLNELSRDCVEKKLSLPILEERLDEIRKMKPSPIKTYLGSAIAAGSFALFFGGGIWDGLIAACIGFLVGLLQSKIADRFPNKAFFLFSISLVTGCGVCLLAKALPFVPLQIDKIIIGDTITGVTKLLECLLWAGCLAAGFIVALMLCGR